MGLGTEQSKTTDLWVGGAVLFNKVAFYLADQTMAFHLNGKGCLAK